MKRKLKKAMKAKMADEEKKNESGLPPDTPQTAEAEPVKTDSSAESKKEDKKEAGKSVALEKENGELQAQLKELNDKYLRLAAEYDNYRKRTAKEKSETYSDAFSDATAAFLPLIDSLESALSYDGANEGIQKIVKLMYTIFEKLGVKEIESDGKTFDPQLHNAIMHEEDPEKGESIIVQTLQKGYTLNGKVIRHSMVKVVN